MSTNSINREWVPAKKKHRFIRHIGQYWQIYLMLLVPIVYYIVFRYLPMFGNIIAFRKYRAGGSIFGSQNSGLKYFKQFIGDKSFWRAFRNTLTLNFTYLLFRFPLTLIFALLINEIRNLHWKKFVQTVSYLPHFISMVIVCGVIKELLGTTGPINNVIVSMGGRPEQFLSIAKYFVPIFTISGIWQSMGWGTILYLSAITGINMELFEAAKIDGANKMQQIWHVTLPGIRSTIVILLILSIGQMMNISFDRPFIMGNPMVQKYCDVLSTFVYRAGITNSQFARATAIGLFQSVVGLILISCANFVTKRLGEDGIW